jgi:predicted RNase H-like nuclease
MSPALAASVDIAGVDGCKEGWIAVIRRRDGLLSAKVFGSFGDILAGLSDDAVVAVDMPIGLLAFTRQGGRGPEVLVRRLLGARQSSVFSIPSRAAVFAADEPFITVERWYEAHRIASAVARRTSDPPRGVSIQAFGIFSKIRELDRLLRERQDLREFVVESHPEVAFWRLNGERAMTLPKKVKGSVNPAGMAERRALLASHGIESAFLDARLPRGAGEDDLLDAAAMLLIAARHARGDARPFPDPPGRDEFGIPVAIWA